MIKDELMRNAIAAMAQMDNTSGLNQSVIVVEECSELIKELMKKERKKGNNQLIIEEACDVLAAVFVLLYQYGASEDNIRSNIFHKYNRALARYNNTGEL